MSICAQVLLEAVKTLRPTETYIPNWPYSNSNLNECRDVQKVESSNNYQTWTSGQTLASSINRYGLRTRSGPTKFNERIFMFIAEAIGNKCATADVEKRTHFSIVIYEYNCKFV